MIFGNTNFNVAHANQVSKEHGTKGKALFVKTHAHLKDHVGDNTLEDIYDVLTKKEEAAPEVSANPKAAAPKKKATPAAKKATETGNTAEGSK